MTYMEDLSDQEAKKRFLKSDGHGGWLDVRGNYPADLYTEGERLRLLNIRSETNKKEYQRRYWYKDILGQPYEPMTIEQQIENYYKSESYNYSDKD